MTCPSPIALSIYADGESPAVEGEAGESQEVIEATLPCDLLR